MPTIRPPPGRLRWPPAGRIAIALVLVATFTGAAAGQSLFEALFGGQHSPRETPRSAPPASAPHAYADPGRDSDPTTYLRSRRRPTANSSTPAVDAASSGWSGGSLAYCVRLCDGRYFPLTPQTDRGPAELCTAFCPASRTKVFFGGEIESARAQDGTRYPALENAFVYRKRVVAGCTCNGRGPFGLAAIDPAADTTLRPGDLIATRNGLMAFRGWRSRQGSQTADLTPVDKSRLGRDRLGSVAPN